MWPRWMSGAVGSIPSFTRSGRPSVELRPQRALGEGVNRISEQKIRIVASRAQC